MRIGVVSDTHGLFDRSLLPEDQAHPRFAPPRLANDVPNLDHLTRLPSDDLDFEISFH